MKDILIKLKCDAPWRFDSYIDTVKVAIYKDWIKANLKKGTYHFPRNEPDKVYFLNEEDLTMFTLVHGHVYEIIGVGHIDMTAVNRMIWNATIMEKYENDKNT